MSVNNTNSNNDNDDNDDDDVDYVNDNYNYYYYNSILPAYTKGYVCFDIWQHYLMVRILENKTHVSVLK